MKTPPARWTDCFDGNLAIRPPLSPEALGEIPAKRGVFLLEGPGGEPILLSTAANIRSRMRFRLSPPDEQPGRRADLREVARRLRWKRADSHFETDWHFLELARRVYPATYRKLLSFHPAWFVSADLSEAVPWLHRTQEPATGAGQCIGPLPSRRAAARLIGILQDVFDLCRDEQLFRRGDRSACVYAQMGRCPAPCEGGPPADQYRDRVAEACACARGGREPVQRRLTERMRRCAAEKRYEQAAGCKARLDRLAELDRPEFAHLASVDEFRYLLVQRGPRRRQMKVFLADRGAIEAGPTLDWPGREDPLAGALAAMRRLCGTPRPWGRPEIERIALVSHYLLVSPRRRGAIVRYDEHLSVKALADRIESAADVLGLAGAPPPGPTGDGDANGEKPTSEPV